MQIEFVPHKIKAAKAYIENLYEDGKVVKIEKQDSNLSFFQKLKRLFFR